MHLPLSIRTKILPHVSPNVKVYYPVIFNLSNHGVQQKMNHAIVATLNTILIEQSFYESSLVELIAYYELKTNQRGILSLNIIVYSFTGGAHGMTIIKSLTFDTTIGKQYTLKELFKPGTDYEKELSSIIKKKITDWDIQLIGKFEGIRADQDFYIADSVLVIYFQLYEITPYVWGFPYFPIPIMDIKEIIEPGGALERMMSFT
ncbi:DUF3298 and DUF4163 domain-containing protein [Sporosarcina sp. CAU 1771]